VGAYSNVNTKTEYGTVGQGGNFFDVRTEISSTNGRGGGGGGGGV
jgi:hypothetical protein